MKKKITLIALLIAGFAQGQTHEWANTTGGTSYDIATVVRSNSQGAIVTGGSFLTSIDLDPGAGTQTYVTAGPNNNGFLQMLDSNGDFMWAGTLSTSMYSTIEDIEIDANDNIYVSGGYSGTADFGMTGPSSLSTAVTQTTSTYNLNGFVAKYNSVGELQWVYSFSDGWLETANALKLELSNDGSKVYTMGNFRGSMDVDPLSGAGFISSGNSNISSAFLIELTSAGGYANSYDLRYAYTGDLKVDANGDIIYSGYSVGTTDFDLNAGFNNNISPVNTMFSFISKIEPDYDPVWVYDVNGIGANYYTWDLTTDDNNNCYLSGEFTDVFDFDNTAGTFEITGNASSTPFLLKLDAAGDFVWVISDLYMNDLIIDQNGDLLHAGSFNGTQDFDPAPAVDVDVTASVVGSSDAYIRKLDVDGNYIWHDIIPIANGLGGGAPLPFSNVLSMDIHNSSIYALGVYNTDVYIDNTPYSSVGQSDFFQIKYDFPCVAMNNVTASGLTLTTDAPSGLSYQWIDCDNGNAEIVGETGLSFTATMNGSYAVVVNTGTCSDTSNCMLIDNVGIEENTMVFNISPNPSNGVFHINSTVKIELVTITNGLGQTILNVEDETSFDISEFGAGVYFVAVKSEEGWNTQKLIKK